MQQLHNTQTGLKKHGSNPLLGVTFGRSHKIISVCMDILGQIANDVYTDNNWCYFERGQRYSTVQYSKLSGSARMSDYGK